MRVSYAIQSQAQTQHIKKINNIPTGLMRKQVKEISIIPLVVEKNSLHNVGGRKRKFSESQTTINLSALGT